MCSASGKNHTNAEMEGLQLSSFDSPMRPRILPRGDERLSKSMLSYRELEIRRSWLSRELLDISDNGGLTGPSCSTKAQVENEGNTFMNKTVNKKRVLRC